MATIVLRYQEVREKKSQLILKKKSLKNYCIETDICFEIKYLKPNVKKENMIFVISSIIKGYILLTSPIVVKSD